MEFELHLEQCFHEEELASSNRREVSTLKRMAKLLVEERAVIKRITDDNEVATDTPQNNSTHNLYTVEINLNY